MLFVFLIPKIVRAGFLSSFLGKEAEANLEDAVNQYNNNSQTMPLLVANIAFMPVVHDKKAENEENITASISNNALIPDTSPMGISSKTDNDDFAFDQVSIYMVRKGDTLSQIAEMFNVSINTILVANDMKKGAKIAPDDILFILPISGLEHTVTKGQTLQSIAKLYKVDTDAILLYNGITSDTKLEIGSKLLIPGGEMADEGGDKPAANLESAPARDKNYYDTHPIQSLSGYFINPLPTGRKTQGLHGPGHRGIDIGAPTGTPIYASASGKVLAAKTGWSGGYGNMVIIQHGNGTKTLYAHMSKLATNNGAPVSQGQIIGYVGSTGHSTGPHLHFEVFNAKNPGSDWSWKK